MGNSCTGLCVQNTASKPSSEVSQRISVYSNLSSRQSKQFESLNEFGITKISEPQFRHFTALENRNSTDEELIEAALSKHLLLKHLNYIEINVFLTNMKKFSFEATEIILKQEEDSDYFYIILSGKVEVLVNQTTIAVLSRGHSFGDMTLINGNPENPTVIALEKSELLGIDRQNLRIKLQEMNEEMFESKRRLLEKINLFKDLSSEQIEKLLSVVKTVEFPDETEIIKENTQGDHCYIIKQGRVTCSYKGKKLKEMYEGEYFGELALFHGCKRMATVVAVGFVTLLSLKRADIDSVFENSLDAIVISNCIKFSIEQSPHLNFLTEDQINRMKNIAQIRHFSKGQVVVPRGSYKSEALYSVLKGSLISENGITRTLRCVGDACVLKPSKYKYTCSYQAREDSVVAIYHKEDIEKALKYLLKDLRLMNWLISILKKITIFKYLSKSKIKEIANNIDTCEFPPGAHIFEEKEPANTFYIVKKGSVSIFKRDKVLRVIEKNCYFGERSILLDSSRSATAVANVRTICWVLSKEKFKSLIDERTKELMLRRIMLLDDTVTLNNLRPLYELGHGAFGNVILAEHSKTQFLYAVKYMSREKIKSRNMENCITREKEILLKLDHPLVMKMVKRLKDNERIYMVTEYVRGSDLFDVLEELNTLNNNDCKFYTASLVLILNFLHSQQIIYRDLKPENIMVDEEGYLKLVDFGTAKIIKGRTYTNVGTPHYMAPEVILGKGYSFNADLWSLGIMLYEFVFQKMPFGAKRMNVQNMFRCIIENEMKFPPGAKVNEEVKDLIKQLLNKNPFKRLDAKKCKKHLWFTGVKWNDFIIRNIKAPYKPNIKKIQKFRNFALERQESIGKFIKKIDYMNKF